MSLCAFSCAASLHRQLLVPDALPEPLPAGWLESTCRFTFLARFGTGRRFLRVLVSLLLVRLLVLRRARRLLMRVIVFVAQVRRR